MRDVHVIVPCRGGGALGSYRRSSTCLHLDEFLRLLFQIVLIVCQMKKFETRELLDGFLMNSHNHIEEVIKPNSDEKDIV